MTTRVTPVAKRQRRVMVAPNGSEDQEQTLDLGSTVSNQDTHVQAQIRQEYLVWERSRLDRQLQVTEERATTGKASRKHRTRTLHGLNQQSLEVDRQLVLLRGDIALPVLDTRLVQGKDTITALSISSKRSIRDLPPEVSSIIFRLVVGSCVAVGSDRDALRYVVELFRLMHVCRQWRARIRIESGLWRVSVFPFLPRYGRKTFPLANEVLTRRGTQSLYTYISVDDGVFSPARFPEYTSTPTGYDMSPGVTVDVLTETLLHSKTIIVRGILNSGGKLSKFTYSPPFIAHLPSLKSLKLEDISLRVDFDCILVSVPNLEDLAVHNCRNLFGADTIVNENKDHIKLDKLERLSVFAPEKSSLPGLSDLFRFVSLPSLTQVVIHNEIKPNIATIISDARSLPSLRKLQLGSGWATDIQSAVESLCDLPVPIAELVIDGIVAPRKRSRSGRELLVSIGRLVEAIGAAFSAHGPSRIVFKNCALAPSRLRDAIESAQRRGRRAVPTVMFYNCYLIDAQEWDNDALYDWAKRKVQEAGLGWTWERGGLPYNKRTAVAFRVAENDTPESEDRYFRPGRGPCRVRGRWDRVEDVDLREEDLLQVPRLRYTPLD